MKLIVTGYMGSGKTAVGKALAQDLALPFLDLDEVISKKEDCSINELFIKKGEIYFRRKEGEALKDLLEQERDFVLALGGGTPCYGKNLELIKANINTTLIYLKTGLAELKERLWEEKEGRPLIKNLDSPEIVEDFIRKHMFERTFYYNQSDLIISTDGQTVPQVVAAIKAELD